MEICNAGGHNPRGVRHIETRRDKESLVPGQAFFHGGKGVGGCQPVHKIFWLPVLINQEVGVTADTLVGAEILNGLEGAIYGESAGNELIPSFGTFVVLNFTVAASPIALGLEELGHPHSPWHNIFSVGLVTTGGVDAQVPWVEAGKEGPSGRGTEWYWLTQFR